MSVISDALKAAQRERARRESHGAQPAIAPVLVQLRSKPQASGAPRRLVVLGVGGALVVGVAVIAGWQLNRKPTLPAVPALTSTILAEALAADTSAASKTVAKPPIASVPDTSRRVTARTAPAIPERAATPTRVVAAAPPGDTVAVPQGTAAVVRAADSGARTSGRLRVAMDRPGLPAVAGLFSEATAAHRGGDLATARRLYDSVLVLAPTDADALNNLGVLLSSQREYGRSLDLLRRASTIAPRNAGIWNNLGTVYREQGKDNDAIAAFRHALSLDPQHPGARIGLAQQYIAIGSMPQARALLEDVVVTHPQLSEAHYSLGQVLERMQDRAGAVVAYEAFIRTAPPRLAEYVDLVKRRVEALGR